jgi:hypothetical protein
VIEKDAAPSVGEIEGRHVEHQHRIVLPCGSYKPLAQSLPETDLGLFRFHIYGNLGAVSCVTMKHLQGFSVPLSREDVSLAQAPVA